MSASTVGAYPLETQQCLRTCTECHDTCLSTVTYGIEKGGALADPRYVRLMLDCAQMCQTTHDFMLRGSELHARACALCAEVCAACTAVCEERSDDPRVAQCLDVCRRCTETCRQMA